jgi:hypothetical protein
MSPIVTLLFLGMFVGLRLVWVGMMRREGFIVIIGMTVNLFGFFAIHFVESSSSIMMRIITPRYDDYMQVLIPNRNEMVLQSHIMM